MRYAADPAIPRTGPDNAMEFPVHIPFVELLGFKLLRWENDEAEIRFDAGPEHLNSVDADRKLTIF
jgi:acyl-coenzyme A thioesterase PaaI-like protein